MTEQYHASEARNPALPSFTGEISLAGMAEACGVGLWQWRVAGDVCHLNASCRELLGLPPGTSTIPVRRFVQLVHGGGLGALEAARAAPRAEAAPMGEFKIHRADTGEPRWLSVRSCWLEGTNGGGPVLAGLCLDVTALRQEQEAKDLLNQEAGHRMKNLLSVVGSLATLSGEHRPEARDFVASFQSRLNSLAATHTLLVQSNWRPIGFAGLIEKVLTPLGVADRIEISGGTQFLLGSHDAHTLALVLHELATNALKYGALSNGDGRVRLEVEVRPVDGDTPTLLLRWEELDGPAVTPPTAKGFGLTLLTRLTRSQEQCDPLLQWRASGLLCTACFKLTPADRSR